jgi:hypothetical protein
MAEGTWDVGREADGLRSSNSEDPYRLPKELAAEIDSIVQQFLGTVWPREQTRFEAMMPNMSPAGGLVEEFPTPEGYVRIVVYPNKVEWRFDTTGVGGNYLSVENTGLWAFIDITDGPSNRGPDANPYFARTAGGGVNTGIWRIKNPRLFVTAARLYLGEYLKYRGYVA